MVLCLTGWRVLERGEEEIFSFSVPPMSSKTVRKLFFPTVWHIERSKDKQVLCASSMVG